LALGRDTHGKNPTRKDLTGASPRGFDQFPVASAALERLLAEPTPEDPAKDDIWVSLVVGLAQEQLAHAFADQTLD
jgi:hypothetical protein